MNALGTRLRWTATALTLAIAVFAVAWCLTPRITVQRVFVGMLLATPLLIALPGLVRDVRRTYAWMSLAVAPYLALALMEVIANPNARVWAGACVFAAFTLFIVLIARLRLLTIR